MDNAYTRPHFTDSDLRFVAETVGGPRPTPEENVAVLRERDGLLDVMLEDDRLVQRLLSDDHTVVGVSPRLVFSILLRRVARDLNDHAYTLERAPGETIAVFDALRVRRFIADPAIWSYLVTLLASFVRNESVSVLVRRGDRVVRRRFSTSSLEDMMTLAGLVGDDEVAPLFRRIADIALFQSGVFSDSLRRGRVHPGSRRPPAGPLTLDMYEEHGRRFYRLAASQGGPEGPVLEALADEFPAARKSLELLSDRYLRWSQVRWFRSPLE